MNFQVSPLPAALFRPLFELSDGELRNLHACRLVVNNYPGFPCRITLEDAPAGETVIAVPFQHLPENSPYQSSGPIFVRRYVEACRPAVNQLPPMLTRRPQSIRAYSAEHMMIAADIADGDQLTAAIKRLLANPQVAYLHLHNAKPGCFNCRVDRA